MLHKIAVTTTGNAISETLISNIFRGECPRTPPEMRTHNMFDKGIEIPSSPLRLLWITVLFRLEN